MHLQFHNEPYCVVVVVVVVVVIDFYVPKWPPLVFFFPFLFFSFCFVFFSFWLM